MGTSYRQIAVITVLLVIVPQQGMGQQDSAGNDEARAVQSETATAVSNAAAPATLPKSSSGSTGSRSLIDDMVSNPVIYLMVFMLAFYLLLIVPQHRQTKKAAKELAGRIASLKKNDRVVTSFGVHGVIANINSDVGTVTIRIDENSNAKMTVERDSIRVVKKD